MSELENILECLLDVYKEKLIQAKLLQHNLEVARRRDMEE